MENMARSQWLRRPPGWFPVLREWHPPAVCRAGGRGRGGGRGAEEVGSLQGRRSRRQRRHPLGRPRGAGVLQLVLLAHLLGCKRRVSELLKSRTLPTLWLFRSLCWNMLMSVAVFINGWSNPRPAAAILQLRPQPGNSVTTSQHHLTLRRHQRPRETPGAGGESLQTPPGCIFIKFVLSRTGLMSELNPSGKIKTSSQNYYVDRFMSFPITL